MTSRNPVLRALRRQRRKLTGLFQRPGAQLVYSRRYQLDLPGALYDPLRGERILAFLESTGLLTDRALHTALPASFRYLRRVHTDDYLDTLNLPESYLSILGQEISDEQAERVLEAQRTMVGGTLLATGLAMQSKGIGVNLGGGLHHAFAAKGQRFCMLNDVAVAIAELRARGVPGPVLVVDLDLHDGDGTRSIFAEDPTIHTFSIHNMTTSDERGSHAVAATVVELAGTVEDAEYLAAVRQHLPPVFAAFRPEIVFYIAGCDPAADDRIGNWKITAAALLERDLLVLSRARGKGSHRPLVIVLGGGYGHGAWRYTARFLSALLNRGKPIEPPDSEESLLQRYRRMARDIAPHELTGDTPGDDWGLTADDIAPVMGGMRRPHRLLGYYSRQGLELAFERAGLLDRLRSRGFEDLRFDLELGDPAGDTVRLYGVRLKRELLMEARLTVDRHTVPGMALLRIEWLLLQNPRATFTAERPPLPGQRHPGLGLLADILALLVLACDRLQLDGVLFVPSHFHTIVQGKNLRFLSPEDEGLIRSVRAALEGLPLATAGASVAAGRVVDAETGHPFVWTPRPMVLPVTARLRQQVEGEDYERRAAEAAARHAFALSSTKPL
ncbi:MAG TPA: histone deacetylase [Thermoanaerobaculia bacterium]|jgi:acetoin utilization deacetylase AcuC-like enzyme|nr:histone deacetylase [Thermoanaerobaculia bacterium]